MVVRAVLLLAGDTVLALLDFQEVRMVLLLFPAMRVGTLVLIGTSFCVRANEVVHLPARAHFARVSEHRGTPPVVLPIVRIHAYLSVVVILTIRTPHCLKYEHVEVHVNRMLLDELDGELALIMRE